MKKAKINGLLDYAESLYGIDRTAPLRVVAHAICRKKRGRKPSLSFEDKHNPKIALQEATFKLESNLTSHFMHIGLFVISLFLLSKYEQKTRSGAFNAKKIYAHPWSEIDDVFRSYYKF